MDSTRYLLLLWGYPSSHFAIFWCGPCHLLSDLLAYLDIALRWTPFTRSLHKHVGWRTVLSHWNNVEQCTSCLSCCPLTINRVATVPVWIIAGQTSALLCPICGFGRRTLTWKNDLIHLGFCIDFSNVAKIEIYKSNCNSITHFPTVI